MPMIAVVAHTGKSFGGGLRELREVLAQEGFADPLWYEVTKAAKRLSALAARWREVPR
jgi:diacylglycerol kinase (ATP)